MPRQLCDGGALDSDSSGSTKATGGFIRILKTLRILKVGGALLSCLFHGANHADSQWQSADEFE